MKEFALYIEDERYSVPTLVFVTAKDGAHIRELALIRLEDSPHHLSVEVYDGDAVIYRLSRIDPKVTNIGAQKHS